MKDYDIIVAGAGPAGLSAAGRLSKNKRLDVLLIEKNKIGETSNTWAASTDLIKKRGLSRSIERSFRNINFHTYALGYIKTPMDYSVIDQKKLLHLLRSRIGKNITLYEKCSFISFRHKDGLLTVKTNKGDFRCKILIDASSFRSPVTRHYHLQDDIFVCQCFIYELMTETKSLRQLLWDMPFKSKHGVDFWIDIKNSKRCDVGLMHLTKPDRLLMKRDIKRYINKYLRHLNVRKYRILGEKGGILAMNNLQRLSFENILLVGNSASQAAPDSGYGLIPALDNGVLAAKISEQAIKSRDYSGGFLKKYDKKWKNVYGLNYRLNRILQKLHYYLDFDTLNFFINKMKSDASWIAKKNNGMLSLKDIKGFHKKIDMGLTFALFKKLPLFVSVSMLKDYFLVQWEVFRKRT